MKRLGISAKIWLSVGIFAAGYVVSIGLGLYHGRSLESSLTASASTLFPAAQLSQDSVAGFQRMLKAYNDAVLMEDAGALDAAAQEAAQLDKALGKLMSLGIGEQRSRKVRGVRGVVTPSRRRRRRFMAR